MIAKRLAEALGDVAVAAGIRNEGTEVACEAEQLLSEPVTWFLRHPNWPSGLAPRNVPIELSISIAGDGTPCLRYSADGTDHRLGLGGNWARYLREATRLASEVGVSPAAVWKLLATVLDGAPPLFRSRLTHGVGYAAGGEKRVSFYFSTRWLTDPNFRDRFPELADSVQQAADCWGSPAPPYFDGLAYDLPGRGTNLRTKLYHWLGDDQPLPLSQMVGRHPDLAPAEMVFDHFLSSNPPPVLSGSLLLQWSVLEPGTPCRQKLMFECTRWGWGNPQPYLELLSFLCRRFEMNLGPLHAMLAVFAEYGISLKPTLLAIEPGTVQPSVTFYFCPILEEPVRWTATPAVTKASPQSTHNSRMIVVEEMTTAATDFLLSEKERDGHWVDFGPPTGPSNVWVTAYVAAILSRMTDLHAELAHPARILKTWFRPGHGWGQNGDSPADADSTALALLALQRLGQPLPAGASDCLALYRLDGGGYRHQTNSDVDDEQGTRA